MAITHFGVSPRLSLWKLGEDKLAPKDLARHALVEAMPDLVEVLEQGADFEDVCLSHCSFPTCIRLRALLNKESIKKDMFW
jgi:hypothetical protein